MQIMPATGFNPRSRTGSDYIMQLLSPSTLKFQSTLPHGERPEMKERVAKLLGVSIHAPARGATERSRFLKMPQTRFQSTLPHGERPGREKRIYKLQCSFNPRSRTGSDVTFLLLPQVWGGFNPRSRTGSDKLEVQTISSEVEFQSTLPHGERRR